MHKSKADDLLTNLLTGIRNVQIKCGQAGSEGDSSLTVSQVLVAPEIGDQRKEDDNEEVE